MRAIGGAQQRTVDARLHALWVGDAHPAIEALWRLGWLVSHVDAAAGVQQATGLAPDVLVVCGADSSRVDALVRELRDHAALVTLPVITISPGAPRMQTPRRRAGIVARLATEFSPHVLANEVHERSSQLTSCSPMWDVEMSWFELDGWLATALRDASSGLLICGDPAGAIALGASGSFAPSAHALRAAFAAADTDEPRSLRFLELPASRFCVLTKAQAQDEPTDLSGAQVVVAHVDAARAEALCAAFAEAGAEAHAVGVDPSALAGVASFAPMLLVVGASALDHASLAVLWEDARLASVSWLIVDDSAQAALSSADVLGRASTLIATARQLQQRLVQGELVVDRIERFGTAGWLKEVGRCTEPLTLVMQAVSGRSELSLAAGRIRDATFAPADGGPTETGRAALQASLTLHFGRVLVGPKEAVIAFEAAPVRKQDTVSGAPAKAPEPEVSDFQECPTASRAALKPRTGRTLRPAAQDKSRALSKQGSRNGRVLPLKISAPPPRHFAAPAAPPPAPAEHEAAQVIAPDDAQAGVLAQPSPQVVLATPARDEVPTFEFPAALERPEPAVMSAPLAIASGLVANDTSAQSADVHAQSVSSPAVSSSSLTDQIAADIERELARAEDADEPTEVMDTPHKTRWSLVIGMLVIGMIAVLACAAAALVVLQRAPRGPLRFEELADTVREALLSIQTSSSPHTDVFVRPAGTARELAREPTAQDEAEAAPAPAPQEELRPSATAITQEPLAAPSEAQPSLPTAEPNADDEAEPVDVARVPDAEPSHEAAGEQAAAESEREVAQDGAGASDEHTTLEALVSRAKQARERGRYVQAEALLTQALRLAPADFGARYQLALVLVLLRRFDEAQAELARATELEPDSPLPWLLRGDILLQVGSRREALQAWTKCRALRPDFQACEQRLARWAKRPGQGDEPRSE